MTAALTSDTTVGRIVADAPAAARVFEKYGIDYCCGGRLTLREACAKKKLASEAVLAEVHVAAGTSAGPERNWSAAGMTELADHIERAHHDYLRAELPRLGQMTRKVAAVHGDGHPELRELADVFAGFAEDLAEHMAKEERVLFPALRRMEAAVQPGLSIAGPIACMIHEHQDAGGALERMRALTGGYEPPADACGTYRVMLDGLRRLESDMHQHVHKENNILFPKAIAAATAPIA